MSDEPPPNITLDEIRARYAARPPSRQERLREQRWLRALLLALVIGGPFAVIWLIFEILEALARVVL
jgi:hypothetical protein